jgi:putative ABC transport system substrate-binding protein
VPGSLQAAQAAKQATATIPIVVGLVGSPVECGLVASLARPGGNITGGAWVGIGLVGKLLELLKEVRPTLSRIGILWNPDNCADPGQVSELQAAGRARKVQILPFEARTPDDVKKAFPLLARGRVEALVVLGGQPFFGERGAIAELAKRQQLPVLSVLKEFTDQGALATYGPNFAAANRRATILVDKILKGAKPADLPMERPTVFELVINLGTAKALGLTIPPSVLARADEVIQ